MNGLDTERESPKSLLSLPLPLVDLRHIGTDNDSREIECNKSYKYPNITVLTIVVITKLLVLSRNAVISRGFNKAEFPTYVFLANAIPTIIASPSGIWIYQITCSGLQERTSVANASVIGWSVEDSSFTRCATKLMSIKSIGRESLRQVIQRGHVEIPTPARWGLDRKSVV